MPPITLDIVFVVAAVAILWKSADLFVEGAVGVAEKLHVPHMFVGLVLVSITTSAPELVASIMAALQGKPEAALGNAIGSVSADESLALGLAALVSATPIACNPKFFRSSAIVLLSAFILAFFMAKDGTLNRVEGAILVSIYVGSTVYSYLVARRDRKADSTASETLAEGEEELGAIEAHLQQMTTSKIAIYFVIGFIGVLGGSNLLLHGAFNIAESLGVSEFIIGAIVVAIGTSTPEIATCVSSALKGKGGIGVGSIIGSDIINICLVAGLSATVNPLTVNRTEIMYSFPVVFVIVVAMLSMLRYKYQLVRWNGAILVSLYGVYLFVTCFLMPHGAPPAP